MDFGLADETGARDSLLSKAVANARGRAAILAEASGGRLGQALSISYDHHTSIDDNDDSLYMVGALEPPRGQTAAPRFQTSPIELSCRVDTEWELLDVKE